MTPTYPAAIPLFRTSLPVLFPQGQPSRPSDRELCADLLLAAGADVSRFIDGPIGDLDRYLAYIARVADFCSGPSSPMIVLTQASPLPGAAVNVRRRMERVVPALRFALWLIYLRPETASAATGASLGWLMGELHTAPIWAGPRRERFLVMSPLIENVPTFVTRATSLTRQNADRKARHDASSAPTSGTIHAAASALSLQPAARWAPAVAEG